MRLLKHHLRAAGFDLVARHLELEALPCVRLERGGLRVTVALDDGLLVARLDDGTLIADEHGAYLRRELAPPGRIARPSAVLRLRSFRCDDQLWVRLGQAYPSTPPATAVRFALCRALGLPEE